MPFTQVLVISFLISEYTTIQQSYVTFLPPWKHEKPAAAIDSITSWCRIDRRTPTRSSSQRKTKIGIRRLNNNSSNRHRKVPRVCLHHFPIFLSIPFYYCCLERFFPLLLLYYITLNISYQTNFYPSLLLSYRLLRPVYKYVDDNNNVFIKRILSSFFFSVFGCFVADRFWFENG